MDLSRSSLRISELLTAGRKEQLFMAASVTKLAKAVVTRKPIRQNANIAVTWIAVTKGGSTCRTMRTHHYSSIRAIKINNTSAILKHMRAINGMNHPKF
jgi:hypothetical protein